MVSFVDFGPTLLSLTGVIIPGHMQGVAFLGAQAGTPRQRIHAIKDRMDERIDMSRTVRDERYKYHRNYLPYLPHYPWLDYMDMLDTSKELRRLAAANDLADGLTYFMAERKNLEELYDLRSDPYEMNNLSGDPRYESELRRLRDEHFSWVRTTVDTGLIPEQMLRNYAAGSSEHEYARSGAYLLERCIATARLMERGEMALPELLAALQDNYPPVRFWAAAGLANLGPRAAAAVSALRTALDDPESEVALTAAEALCYAGYPEPALPVIAGYLGDDRQYVAITAANVADRIGEQARPLIDLMRREIQAAASKEGRFFRFVDWLLSNAVRELEAGRVNE